MLLLDTELARQPENDQRPIHMRHMPHRLQRARVPARPLQNGLAPLQPEAQGGRHAAGGLRGLCGACPAAAGPGGDGSGAGRNVLQGVWQALHQ